MDRESLYLTAAGCVGFLVIAYGSYWYFSRTEAPVMQVPAAAPEQAAPRVPAYPPAQAMPSVPASDPSPAAVAAPTPGVPAPGFMDRQAAPSPQMEKDGQDDEERPRAVKTPRIPVEPGRNRNKTPDKRKQKRAEYVDD